MNSLGVVVKGYSCGADCCLLRWLYFFLDWRNKLVAVFYLALVAGIIAAFSVVWALCKGRSWYALQPYFCDHVPIVISPSLSVRIF
jgi:hypothetical protein